MVAVLEECATEEQCSVVRFLWIEGLNAKDIHTDVFPVYCGKCFSHKAVHNWVQKFSQGRLKLADDVRLGRPVEISTEAIVHRVEELIRDEKRIPMA
jgi:transposase